LSGAGPERTLDRILAELAAIAGRTSEEDLSRFAERILDADRIYVTGVGRSGLMARAFAMRLMHLGLRTFVVGETTTPSIEKGDLLLCCSRYGRSGSVLHYADMARDVEAAAVLITMDPGSPLAAKCADVLVIPVGPDDSTRQPLGTQFEQLLLLTLDALVIVLMKKRGYTEREMARLHTNLE
jgi:6-phospho-3-hexuloisomerase